MPVPFHLDSISDKYSFTILGLLPMEHIPREEVNMMGVHFNLVRSNSFR
jgi:hypothetical protein